MPAVGLEAPEEFDTSTVRILVHYVPSARLERRQTEGAENDGAAGILQLVSPPTGGQDSAVSSGHPANDRCSARAFEVYRHVDCFCIASRLRGACAPLEAWKSESRR